MWPATSEKDRTMSWKSCCGKAMFAVTAAVMTGYIGFLSVLSQNEYPNLTSTAYSGVQHLQFKPANITSGATVQHFLLRVNPVEMVPDLLNHDKLLKPSMTPAAMETAFNRWVRQVQILCTDKRRLGNTGDGGWDVCFDPPFHMKQNNCLVYSFGIKNDWTFDDKISKQYGCRVHAFDPSIRKPDHNRSTLISFHNLGLRGHLNGTGRLSQPFTNSDKRTDWKMDTLNGIRTILGHKEEVIDYLKVDIEKSELYALPAIFQDGDLWAVKQLGIEVHTSNEYAPNRLLWIYLQLLQLELLGFRRFHYHENIHCFHKSAATGNRITDCHEIYYLNTKFITQL